jgi:drug/metabolite transporter (DMT)-like permease
MGLALALVIAGSILLGWNSESDVGFSIGAAGIILSCLLWGIDNNAMAQISTLPSSSVVVIKGLCGGSIAFLLVLLLHEPFPGWAMACLGVATGFLFFGGGMVLFVYALRTMGAARAGAIYAAAPFIGCIASLLIFSESPGDLFWVALPLFLAGSLIIVYEQWTRRKE